MSAPTRARQRALSDALRSAVRGPGPGLAQRLHWLSHTEALLLRAGSERADWTAALPALPAEDGERLSRELRRLHALSRQLAALRTHQVVRLLAEPASTSVWHEWLHLILVPAAAPPSAERAAQLAALEQAYRRRV